MSFLRSSSRVQAPPVNLKERIAALQQRTGANASSAQRSVSPTPQPTPHSGTSSNTASGLREKIARFEKKGGVPVPRGSFGLGAPPLADGHPRRQGELYGNRIPQPVRVVSGPGGSGSAHPQRANSPLSYGPGPSSAGAGTEKRRSFSLSNVNVTTDYFNHDGTPLTSPSLSSPPESPHVAVNDVDSLDAIPRTTATPPPSSFATVLESAGIAEKAPLQDAPPVVIEETRISEEGDTTVSPEIMTPIGESSNMAENTLATGLPPVEEEEVQEPAPKHTDGEDVRAAEPSSVEGTLSTSSSEDVSHQHSQPDPPAAVEPGSSPASSINVISSNDSTKEASSNSINQSTQLSPSEPAVIPSPSPSQVPSSHKLLLRAAGLGSPPTDTSQMVPSIPEVIFSDDESAIISPVMAISSPPPMVSILESQPSSSRSLGQALSEPHPEPQQSKVESVVKKAPPPALSLDGVTLPLSPPLSSDVLASSHLERSGSKTDAIGSSVNVKDDSRVEKVKQVEVVPLPSENAEIEVVREAVQVPSSPTTPHAPQFSLSPTHESESSRAPSSSFLVTQFSSTPSIGSDNISPIRPLSMVELSPAPSPSHIQVAQRVTPSTSRGVPMFLPSTHPTSALPRKSDLVYYPPTPPDKKRDLDEDEGMQERVDELEHGSVTILPQRPHSVGDTTAQSSFKAVVHHKRREVEPVVNKGPLIPQTPQVRRTVSAMAPTTTTTASSSSAPIIPPSPGFGDLTDLLQSTVLLEQSLEKGSLPTESSVPVIVSGPEDGDGSHETIIKRADGVEVRRLSREEAEENRRTLAKLQAKREEQAKSKIRSTFRNTLARAKNVAVSATASMYVDEDRERLGSTATLTTTTSSMDIGDVQQQYYSKRFKSPSVPHLLDSVREDGLRPKTPEEQIGMGKPASLTSKSPKSRFPSFRRLASKSHKDGHGGSGDGHTRNSVSTSSEISSEDSAPTAVTPPDVASELGEVGKGGAGGTMGGLSWPSISPSRKGKEGKEGRESSSIARAATFAGKMWQRARTKSGASTLSTHSTSGECFSPIMLDVLLI